MNIKIVGIHRVPAPEPCHLIELMITDIESGIDMFGFTQPLPEEPESSWQVPYDERYLNDEGDAYFNQSEPFSPPNRATVRIAFFFHYLDVSKPIETPVGPIELPAESQVPSRLHFVKYEVP